MSNHDQLHLETRVIHGNQSPDPLTGAVMPPIYQTSTYAQKSPGVHQGYEYSRSENPTRFAYERLVANLESAKYGFAFASGLAAVATILELLNAGDHVIVMHDIYGGTYRLFERIRTRSANLQFTFVDMNDEAALQGALKPNTKMIWVETPSNPMLHIVDLTKMADFAKKHKLLSVADNTFATPIIQRPIEHGFDIVMHSATKYLNGHSDVVGGVALTNQDDLGEQLKFLQFAVGAIPGPMDSFLVLRGIKTLALRMERHSQSALKIAEWLEQHSKVQRVYYPGLSSHPQYAIAQKQMALPGGMISATLTTDLEATKAILSRCQIFTLAESLGGVESLIEHPAIMTHASLTPEAREKLGIHDGFIRISVGVENADDLIADLTQALG